jgi:outer membrane lipoprotein-sorting protein
MLVEKVKFTEQSGDYTLIEFVNKKRNETIPDTIFMVQ